MSLQTRRKFLEQALVVGVAADLKANRVEVNGLEIISEPNCLSKESADGFRSLVASECARECQSQKRNIVLLCGTSTTDRRQAFQLRERAAQGAWILWESSPV